MVEEVDRKLDYEDEFGGHYEDDRYAEGLAVMEEFSDEEEDLGRDSQDEEE